MQRLIFALVASGVMITQVHAEEFLLQRLFPHVYGAQSAVAEPPQLQAQQSTRQARAGRAGEHERAVRNESAPRAEVGGRSFTTMSSYYGGGPRSLEPNGHTANGERFNQWGLTAAHRTLPMGTRLLVTHGGRSVVVRVNDRGPAAWTGRSLDVSRGAAQQLGLIGPGTGQVQVQVLASR